MLEALYIFVDDEFDDPVYGDPDREDLDPDWFTLMCEIANECFEADRAPNGTAEVFDEYRVGWRFQSRVGLSFIALVTDDVSAGDLDTYLKELQKQYLDEVDTPREPEREGVQDVVVDVIPPWED